MRVLSLAIYPVKACRGTALREAVVEPRGFENDRRWMIVDAQGRFLSQRELPRLAALAARAEAGRLELRDERGESLSVPVPPPSTPRAPVVLWGKGLEGHAAGPEADAWLTRRLGAPCRLVYQGDLPHEADPRFAPAGTQTRYTDGYPLLVTTAASLEDLNRRLSAPIPMDRFRPNIVVEGAPPWGEDAWRRLRVGPVELSLVKPCARCAVTTVDQQTGRKTGVEPLKTLASFRTMRAPGINGAIFGQNGVPLGTGAIRVGDPVEVLETGPAPAFA